MMRFYLILVALLAVSAGAFAQGRQKAGDIKVGNISFEIPEGLTIKDDGKADGILLAFDPTSKYGVFIALQRTGVQDVVIEGDAYEKGLRVFYNEPNKYKWKGSELQLYTSLSKYQVANAAVQGYNGRNRSLIHAYHIKYKDKDFFTGYLDLDNSADAKDSFETGYDLGRADGCEAVVKIIFSVTNEKFSDSKNPCSSGRPQGRPSGD